MTSGGVPDQAGAHRPGAVRSRCYGPCPDGAIRRRVWASSGSRELPINHLASDAHAVARRLPAGRAPVRPLPRPPARAADRAPRRSGRSVGQARGLQLRAGLRRQQDPEARVPRGRRPGQGLRHAGLDRRCPVEPHTSGRSRGRTPRPRSACWCRSTGSSWDDPGYDTGGQHPPLADHGRGRPARRTRASTSASGRAGRRRSTVGRGVRRQAATRSPQAPPTTRWAGHGFAGWADEVAAAGGRARRLLRHDRRLLGHRLDPGRHDRRASPGTSAPRRVLGIDASATVGADLRADRCGSRDARPESIGLGRELADDEIVLLDELARRATYGVRRPRRRSRRSACAPGSRGCSPTRSTRGSRWRR